MTKQHMITELFKVYFESNGFEPNSSFPRAASASSSSTTTLVARIAPPHGKAGTKTEENKKPNPNFPLTKHADVKKEKATPIGADPKTKPAPPVKDHAPPQSATTRSSKAKKMRAAGAKNLKKALLKHTNEPNQSTRSTPTPTIRKNGLLSSRG